MDTTHPSGCACQHVVGYRAREADGGGIPTIERIAGSVLGRDYGRSSTWGSREAEPVEASQSTSTEVWREESEEVVEELEEVKKNAIPLRRRS